jgi:hypothetical protein
LIAPQTCLSTFHCVLPCAVHEEDISIVLSYVATLFNCLARSSVSAATAFQSTDAFINCVTRSLGEAFNVASHVMMGFLDPQALADPFASEDSSSQLTALGYPFPLAIS